MLRMFFLSVLLVLDSAAFSATELGSTTVDDVKITISTPKMVLNEMTELLVKFDYTTQQNKKNAKNTAKTELVRFDAVMPEHRHGMLVKPSITKLSDTEYVVKGVKLHMPGNWEFILALKNQKGEIDQKIPYVLK